MVTQLLRKLVVMGSVLVLSSWGCSDAGSDEHEDGDDHGVEQTGDSSGGEGEQDPGAVAQGTEELISSVSCKERTDTAYVKGKSTSIKVITIGGKPVSKSTGHAFLKMQKAADAAGVKLAINSGFRTMSEQQYLYKCYQTGNCNNGNLAAKPGYSNHQSGIALDLTTSSWLAKNGTKYGFVRTVPSEAWHWEYKGGSDPGGPCSGTPSNDETVNTPVASSITWVSPKNDQSVSRSDVAIKVNVTNDKVVKVKFFQGTLNFATATRDDDFAVSYSFKYTGDKTLTATGYDADDNEVAGAERNVDVSVED